MWQTILVAVASMLCVTRSMSQKLVYRKDHCCVPGCTNDARYQPHLSFHKFPKDPPKRKAWIIKIRRDESQNNKDPRDDFKVRSIHMLLHDLLIIHPLHHFIKYPLLI